MGDSVTHVTVTVKDINNLIQAIYSLEADDQRKRFGAYLAYLRDLSDRNTNDNAAAKLGVQKKTFQRIIKGHKPQPETIAKLPDLVRFFMDGIGESVEVDSFESWLTKNSTPLDEPKSPSRDTALEAHNNPDRTTPTDRAATRPNLRPSWVIGGAMALTATAFAVYSFLPQLLEEEGTLGAEEPSATVRIDRPVYAQDIAAALENADVSTLTDMAGYGVSVDRFEDAFKTSASAFFANTKDNPEALEWFENLLSSGLSPEARTNHERYSEVSLLFSAFEAGNIEAAKALLANGASPHGYQNILGSRRPDPFFLFPAHAVSKAEHITELEKITLLSSMFEQGFVFYEPENVTYQNSPFQRGDSTLNRTEDELENLFKLTEERPVAAVKGCEIERSRARCLDATNETGVNWCSIMDRVPTVIFVEDRSFREQMVEINVQDLMAISDGSAYFFTTHLYGSQSVYGILEATQDEDTYKYYSYGRPFRRSHVCEFDDDIEMNSFCWRDSVIRKTSETTATLAGSVDVKLFPSCQ